MIFCGHCGGYRRRSHFLFMPGADRPYGCQIAALEEKVKTAVTIDKLNAVVEESGYKFIQRGSFIYPTRIRRRHPMPDQTKPAKPKRRGKIDPNTVYTMCKHCDHFVEEDRNPVNDEESFVHLENGDQHFDHDAEPVGQASLADWQRRRPDLFKKYPDGEIGPNSAYHSRRGKKDKEWGNPDTMTVAQAASLALCVLRPFSENSGYEDYQDEDGWTDEQYAAAVEKLEELAKVEDKPKDG